jgi:hypothetical protein
VMLTVLFDHRGIVHYEYTPDSQASNKEYYVEALHLLRYVVRRKRHVTWKWSDWWMHHHNAPALSSQLVQNFLAKHQIPQVSQPPYSLDIAPCNFFLFTKVKMLLKRNRFQDAEEIKRNTQSRIWLFQRVSSESTLDNGRTTGTSVLCLKRTVLKEIRTAIS